MKITLMVYGKEMTFTTKKLTSIVESHFSRSESEGKWFQVNPEDIDEKLFEEPRENSAQEETRRMIVKALAKVKEFPEKYGNPFETMVPTKTWEAKSINQLKEVACCLGDHMGDCTEQALEWAQRISNGEKWENICNKPDNANWKRFVICNDEFGYFIGGSVCINDTGAPTKRTRHYCKQNSEIYYAHVVPLIIR